MVKNWTTLIKDYIKGRAQLRRVCLLIDSRHGLKPTDHETMDLMDAAAVGYQIVLTKCDKVKAQDMEKLLIKTHSEITKRVAAHPNIVVTSSFKSRGIETLRAELAPLAKTDEDNQIL